MNSPQKLRRLQPVMLALLSSYAPLAAHANAESLVSTLRACAAKPDDAERLRCYDKAMAATPAAPTAAPAAPAVGTNTGQPNAAQSHAAGAGAAPSSPAGVPNAAPLAGEPAAAPVAVAAPVSPDSSFGEVRSPVVKKASAAKPKQMTARVVGVGSSSHGLIVTLDNDQVWAQQEQDAPFPLNVGDTVTVKAGLLGSYWMSGSGAGNRTIRVQRTR